MKRLLITLTAIALFGALGSAARAQTTNQAWKWNHYASHHAATAQQYGLNPATSVPNYMTNYTGANNYNGANAAFEAKYQKNLATYENYMATHPGMAQQGMPYGLPYGSSYPGMATQNYGSYGANPMMQQLSSIPIVSSLAPMLGYGGGYGGGIPAQMPYAASAYPYSRASSYPYAGMPYAQAGATQPLFPHHHQWFNNPYSGGLGASSGIGSQAMTMHSGAGRAAFFASHPFAAARHARWMRNH